MVTPSPEDMPSADTVFKVIYQTAFYDHLLALPISRTLQTIRDLRLERFLPQYFDFEHGKVVDPQAFDDTVQRECIRDHLHPDYFLERQRKERGGILSPSLDQFKELNYQLLRGVLTMSPLGDVSTLVYKVAAARVSAKVGMDQIRGLYRQVLRGISDRDQYTFESLIQDQVLSEHQRFLDELPILEAILREADGQSPEDVSARDIVIFTRHDHHGNRILPRSLVL